MSDLFERMKEHYGEYWNILPPPQAKPIHLIEQLLVPNVNPSEIDARRVCNYNTFGRQILVITKYSVLGFVDIPNPHYVGTLELPLSAIDLAGRLSWRVDVSRQYATENLSVLQTGSVYQNNGAAVLVPASYEQDITLFRIFGGSPSDARIIVEPTKTVSIFIDFHDNRFGIDPPLAGTGFIRAVASLEGYTLQVPG